MILKNLYSFYVMVLMNRETWILA